MLLLLLRQRLRLGGQQHLRRVPRLLGGKLVYEGEQIRRVALLPLLLLRRRWRLLLLRRRRRRRRRLLLRRRRWRLLLLHRSGARQWAGRPRARRLRQLLHTVRRRNSLLLLRLWLLLLWPLQLLLWLPRVLRLQICGRIR